ncbi:MAG: PLP-dependent transferase [Chloroflexi bacterium]|nr:PLP-dependent transferase [Chloroflexota bacterium]
MTDPDSKGPSTRAIHAGVNRQNAHHSIPTPIVRSAPFTFADSADLDAFMFKKVWGGGAGGREEYGREGSETVNAVEQRLAALEGGQAAALFASGMSAFTTLLLAHIKTGEHIILTDDGYKHSREFCLSLLKRLGVEVSVVPTHDYAALEAAIRPGVTRFILSESPTNPLLRLVDFECIAAVGRKFGIETAIDSTFGTPVNQLPLAYGIDYVLHSATKYLGGHHDLVAGVVIGPRDKIAALRDARTILGGILSPDSAYLLERGLRTLALRVARHNDNALGIARYLEAHPKIERVWYPGLESHPDHALALKQMAGYGGVVSFEVKGDLQAANRLIDALEIPYIAVSLGGVESLIGSPAIMAYYELEPEAREAIGIKDNLLRFAVGTEDLDDLIADLDQALAQM